MRSSAKLLVLHSFSALILAGCAATTLPEFEAEQTDRDVIADASTQTDIDPGSTRFVGEVEGAELYIARGDNDTLCLIAIRDQEWEQTGCGSGLGIGTELQGGSRIEAGSFKFPDSEVADGERTKLSESVTVITYP